MNWLKNKEIKNNLIVIIQNKLPHLKEFNVGCRFTIKDEYLPKSLHNEECIVIGDTRHIQEYESMLLSFTKPYMLQRQHKDRNNKHLINVKSFALYQLFEEYDFCEYESRLEDYVDIIGIDPTLADVLMLLDVEYHNELIGLWRLKDVLLYKQNGTIFEYLIDKIVV